MPQPALRGARSPFARRNAAFLAVAALLGAHVSASALVIGVTEGVTYRATDNQIEAKFEGVAEALSKALKQPVTIKVLSTYTGARAALSAQQVDLMFVHPAHLAFEATKRGQYKAVAWTSGFTEYKVSFLCKDPQPIADWKQLAGKSLVTPDPDSITAVMTRAMLRENGLQESAVKITNTRYQDAVPFYVQNGFSAYGATASSGVIKAWKAEGGKTCAESRAVPIKQWLLSTKVDAATANVVRDTLLELPNNDLGKKALSSSGYNAFVAPSADVEKALITWLGI